MPIISILFDRYLKNNYQYIRTYFFPVGWPSGFSDPFFNPPNKSSIGAVE
jgi:hypothetical protein